MAATANASKQQVVAQQLALRGPDEITLAGLLHALAVLLPRPKMIALCQLARSTLRQELQLTKSDFQDIVRCILGEDIVVLQTVTAGLAQQRPAPRPRPPQRRSVCPYRRRNIIGQRRMQARMLRQLPSSRFRLSR